jgi:hypothetical protein
MDVNSRLMKSVWPLFACVVVTTLPAMGSMTSPAPAPVFDQCRASQANWDPGTHKWVLTCIGTDCSTCRSRSKSCNGVQLTGCMCVNQTCPPDDCCQMELNGSGDPTFYGDCPSCGIANTICKACGNTTQNPTSYQPSCASLCVYPP